MFLLTVILTELRKPVFIVKTTLFEQNYLRL